MTNVINRPAAGTAANAVRRKQRDVVEFLSSAAAHGGVPVRRIDTHISHVFLAGERAYKMKRAVRLDFLDYSTLEKRRRQCLAEIAANQAMAADLYLGVVPVTRMNGRLALGGRGEPIEWLVEMVRFDGETQFDRLAAAGRLTPAMMRALADTVASGHSAGTPAPDHGGFAQMDYFLGYVGKALAGADGTRADGLRWQRRFADELGGCAALLDARRRHGFVRRCHGDMHLANICLFNGRPTPFDAIEFDDEIACCDVLYDLAFALMDLIRFGERALANELFNRYLAHTRDYRGLSLMPLFLSMRAGIRAMVAVLGAGKATGIATTFLDLALGFFAEQPGARLIAVGGLSGTGKSTVAAHLATRIAGGVGAVVMRSDVIRKRLFGVAPETPLGPEAYGEDTTDHVYAALLKDARRALRAGWPVIADATFLDAANRDDIAAFASHCGCRFDGIWLQAPAETLRQRLAGRGPDASDATEQVLEDQLRHAVGVPDWHLVDAGGEIESTVANALSDLNVHALTGDASPSHHGSN